LLVWYQRPTACLPVGYPATHITHTVGKRFHDYVCMQDGDGGDAGAGAGSGDGGDDGQEGSEGAAGAGHVQQEDDDEGEEGDTDDADVDMDAPVSLVLCRRTDAHLPPVHQ
jgi:hypothetical protein